MLVSTIYDTERPDNNQTLTTLLLMLNREAEFDFPLPNGALTRGVLNDVTPLGTSGRMVELIIEIDDECEPYYYMDHDQEIMNMVYRR